MAICDVNKVFEEWWIDLFVLGGNEHGRSTHQLHLALGDHFEGQVPVDDVHRQKEGLRQQFEVVVSLNEPIDQSGTDGLLDPWLLLHVVWVNAPLQFGLKHLALDFGTKFRHMVNIIDC